MDAGIADERGGVVREECLVVGQTWMKPHLA